MTYSKTVSLRWADIDPNFHLRHSVYYDLAAQFWVELLAETGLTLGAMQQLRIGPVLFREECVFLREIKLTDTITIAVSLQSVRPDGSRWTIRHQFTNQNGEQCAILTVDGAWIDVIKRKLANPIPQQVAEVMNSFPKTEGTVPT